MAWRSPATCSCSATARFGWPATLYGSLDELGQRGWIQEIDEELGRSADESDKKRIYRLTRAGRKVVATETARLAELVRVARARLRTAGGEPA
jgi:DNA-binding PadR family transcriptional regulator